ncbi:hypothetical protein L9G15_03740 [Shewanella sp. A3A]|nr:hypothetical protein [Shewanella ferrihydritica]
MDVHKLFSPTQIAVATFIGGPLAAVYTIKENYRAMNLPELHKASMIYGLLLTVLIFTIIWFLPENFPTIALNLLYIVAVRYWVEKKQISREQIEQAEQFDFQSNGQVFGISIVAMFATLAVIFGIVMSLIPMDELSPAMGGY